MENTGHETDTPGLGHGPKILDSTIVEHGDTNLAVGSNGMYRIEFQPRFKYTVFSGSRCVHFYCATQFE